MARETHSAKWLDENEILIYLEQSQNRRIEVLRLVLVLLLAVQSYI
jgi:hypothetical protein